ncbi:hypothetical protein GCM10008956_12690 [Deinococcus arenae]|uniref:Uncharacterized protein n=1 Tax=Deinococcus arenae TaxID=1452751 RepID=A0A8H9GM15_9DEIO|nr:hypothetical protein [Deinococcus arenae]GGM37801.1 hypothetical protein GCM10008956_12690 [Deinococcus arenae]
MRRLLLLGLLVACRPAPQAALPSAAPGSPVTLRVQAGALQVQGAGPVTVTCDTPAGPVVRVQAAPGRLAVPPGAVRCEAAAGEAGRPAVVELPAGSPTTPAAPAPPAAPATPATTAFPASSRVAVSGTLRVTPGRLSLGEREVWTVTADVRAGDRRAVPDGTPVELRAAGPLGETAVATRLTVNGVARWSLTPATAGRFTFTAASGAWVARGGAQAVSGLLGQRPRAVFTSRGLTLGPLRWQDGALPDDGTPVRLRALTRSGRVVWSADVAVAGGQVQVDTPRVRDAVTLRVELAGSEVSLPWP